MYIYILGTKHKPEFLLRYINEWLVDPGLASYPSQVMQLKKKAAIIHFELAAISPYCMLCNINKECSW